MKSRSPTTLRAPPPSRPRLLEPRPRSLRMPPQSRSYLQEIPDKDDIPIHAFLPDQVCYAFRGMISVDTGIGGPLKTVNRMMFSDSFGRTVVANTD
jgi:hypothetical protein